MAWRINEVSKREHRTNTEKTFRIILPDVDYIKALIYLNIPTLSERREKHCVDLIVSMSDRQHCLHNLLRERVGETGQREPKLQPMILGLCKIHASRVLN